MHFCANQNIFSLVNAVNFFLDHRNFRDHLGIALCKSIRIHLRAFDNRRVCEEGIEHRAGGRVEHQADPLNGPVGALQRTTDAVFAPVQGGFAAVVRPIGNFFGSILEIGTLRSRIEGLEADNSKAYFERTRDVFETDTPLRATSADASTASAVPGPFSLV